MIRDNKQIVHARVLAIISILGLGACSQSAYHPVPAPQPVTPPVVLNPPIYLPTVPTLPSNTTVTCANGWVIYGTKEDCPEGVAAVNDATLTPELEISASAPHFNDKNAPRPQAQPPASSPTAPTGVDTQQYGLIFAYAPPKMTQGVATIVDAKAGPYAKAADMRREIPRGALQNEEAFLISPVICAYLEDKWYTIIQDARTCIPWDGSEKLNWQWLIRPDVPLKQIFKVRYYSCPRTDLDWCVKHSKEDGRGNDTNSVEIYVDVAAANKEKPTANSVPKDEPHPMPTPPEKTIWEIIGIITAFILAITGLLKVCYDFVSKKRAERAQNMAQPQP